MFISAYNTGNPSAHIGTEVKMSIELAGLLKMSVPSLLYLVQNNLLFFAMSNMDASMYQGVLSHLTASDWFCSDISTQDPHHSRYECSYVGNSAKQEAMDIPGCAEYRCGYLPV